MNEYFNLIIQIILIFSLSIIAFLLMRLYLRLRKEKRITRFSIDAINDKPVSFFDTIIKKYNDLNNKSVEKLMKLKIFNGYAKRYEKYATSARSIETDSMKFISNKINLGLIAIFITLISDVLRLQVISLLQIFLSFFVGFFVLDLFLILYEKKLKKQKEEDLLKAIIIMDNAFKSGKSIMQTVELVANELDGPMSEEFKKMFIDLNYGLDVETVFNRFAERLDFDEARYMSSGLIILNKTGGNIVKIFDSLQQGFFDRKKLKEELKSATALSEFVFKVLCVLPIIIIIIVNIFNPKYFLPLFDSILGKILLIVILLLYLLYIIIIRKISRMED